VSAPLREADILIRPQENGAVIGIEVRRRGTASPMHDTPVCMWELRPRDPAATDPDDEWVGRVVIGRHPVDPIAGTQAQLLIRLATGRAA
jgi:hypothetical protein